MSYESFEGAQDATDLEDTVEMWIVEGAGERGTTVEEYQEYLDGLSPFARDLLRPLTPFEEFAAETRRKKHWPKA